MFKKMHHYPFQTASTGTSLEMLMSHVSQQSMLSDARVVAAAAAAEKRIIDQARIGAALRVQQDLFEQRRRRELLMRLSLSMDSSLDSQERQKSRLNYSFATARQRPCYSRIAGQVDSLCNMNIVVPHVTDSSVERLPPFDRDDSCSELSVSSCGDKRASRRSSNNGVVDSEDDVGPNFAEDCSDQEYDTKDDKTQESTHKDTRNESTPSLHTDNSSLLDLKNNASKQEEPTFTREQEKKWKYRFQEFLQFVRENGHGAVPHTYFENKQLARWVRRQRQMNKNYQNGQKSAMTAERHDLLTSAGFIWDSHEVNWHQRVDALKTYRKKYGDCNVSEKQDKKLAGWAKYLRRQYKLYMTGKPSSINSVRIEQLNKLQFEWQPLKKIE